MNKIFQKRNYLDINYQVVKMFSYPIYKFYQVRPKLYFAFQLS